MMPALAVGPFHPLGCLIEERVQASAASEDQMAPPLSSQESTVLASRDWWADEDLVISPNLQRPDPYTAFSV